MRGGIGVAVVTVIVTSLGAVASSGTSIAAAQTPPRQDSPNGNVRIGFVSAEIGVAGDAYAGAAAGCRARVGRLNHQGGVHGRTVEVTYVDDQSSAMNLTATQDLVENQHVDVVIDDSPFAFVTSGWLVANHVPAISGGYDGNEYGQPGNEQLVSALGNMPPVPGVAYDTSARILKSFGVTRTAAYGFGVSPSSSAQARSFNEYAAPSQGLRGVYTKTSIDFSTDDITPTALGIKASGADGVYYAVNATTALAVAQRLAENGATVKGQVVATAYGQPVLDQAVATKAGPEIVFTFPWAPVEARTKATKRFQEDLRRYAGFSREPGYGMYTGYIDCDLAIRGLDAQGRTFHPATFASTLRSKVRRFNAGGGLGCQDTDIGTAAYGTAPATECLWAVHVLDGRFAVLAPEGSKHRFWTGTRVTPATGPPSTTS